MNKYELKQLKKQKRLEKRRLRKEERQRNKFERLSKTKYKLWHRGLIKTIRIGSPSIALSYAIYRIYDVFWVKVYDGEVLVPDTNLKYLFLSIFFGLFLFMWLYPYARLWIRKARQANANARNTGEASYEYSTFLVDFVQAVIVAWPLLLLYMFNYVGEQIGPEFSEMFNDIAIAYGFGAFGLLVGSMIQDGVLKTISKRQKEAEAQSQMMIYDLSKNNEQNQ